jgi:2-succinyl-6-hydroxy-2,4-cyclohexadiene-1-carboxylate synthase
VRVAVGTPTVRVACGAGRRVAVRECGGGAPLLWLHGFTGAGAGLAPAAARFGPRRHLLVDVLGHGASDAPEGVSAYRFERVLDDVVAVLRARGVPRTDVVGYSMGARLALALAARHPERVRRAVLVAARAGLADPGQRAARARADAELAARIEAHGVPWFVDHWERLPLFASQRRLPQAQRAAIRRERLAGRAAGLAGALRGLGPGVQPPLFARLARLATPVLLVAGEEDPRFVAAARALRARLPRARLVVLPRAGHAAHLENPDAFVRAARAFLAARPPTPAPPRAEPSKEEP